MSENNKGRGRIRREYLKGLYFSLIILSTGIVLEWITGGHGTGIPSWPLNAQVGLSFIIILIFIHFYYRDLNFVAWISRVPAAVSSIALFTILVLFMGLTTQNDPEASPFLKYTGLSHVRNSYPFLLSGIFLLTSLGLISLKRTTPLNFKNFGFLLNHVGLWIVIFAGSLGAGDLQRLTIYVNEEETVWYGYNEREHPVELPFMIKLIDFSIEEFNPKLAYVRTADLSFPEHVMNNLPLINKGKEFQIDNWDIRIDEFFMTSRRDTLGYYFSTDTSAMPSARVVAENAITGRTVSGWISSGNFMIPPQLVILDETYALAMTNPEPKTYNSHVEVTARNGQAFEADIQVNKPLKVSGWNLYQISYDTSMGKWSRLSVIEAIRDPWLVVVYIGFFMVMAGALYLFWLGKKQN